MCLQTILLFTNIIMISANMLEEKIMERRNYLIKKELEMMIGSDIKLSESELKANEIIMKLKTEELDAGFKNPEGFRVLKHFFEYKDQVKDTKLYQLIKNMPKGAVLHAHDTAILTPDYLVNLTYRDNLYVCFEEGNVRFQFSESLPDSPCRTQWQLMSEARYSSGNVDKFDANLKDKFSMVIDNPNEVYTDVNTAWKTFSNYFVTTTSLLTYKPVWEQYFYDSLKALREDNIMYFEIRSVLPPLYGLKGEVYDPVATAESYRNITNEFIADYPDFYGVKLIYAPTKVVDRSTLYEYIRIAKEIQKKMPEFLAGFDLVGQEDLGAPLKEVMLELVEIQKDTELFLHAGETNWYGTHSDENLFDAILLGTKRIGHAYALIKHPLLMEEVKKKDIALEVNVVSNAVLKLVDDVRNHPLAVFMSQNLPVVISGDDPGIWGADPLSHDFYITFVGVASRHADIRVLKKLALNSLIYSTYPNKDVILEEFEVRWNNFIGKVVKENY